jgi:hypothetical protein
VACLAFSPTNGFLGLLTNRPELPRRSPLGKLDEHQSLINVNTKTSATANHPRSLAHEPLSRLRLPITPVANMPATTAETLSLVTRNVSVAPLVLLSAADHYGRQAKGTRKRVVGVLLGQNDGKNVRVSNSFAGELRPTCLVMPATHKWAGGKAPSNANIASSAI